jgi:N-acetyl-1-D-myo-inositol-2-amino-2-deoxy-alpha-D-glucopyranoside deacetylase
MKDAVLPEGLNGRTVLAVFAHPDDESLTCGGTLARLADGGVNVVLLCASRGERGSISDPSLVPDGDLAGVRSRELEAAAAALRIAEVVIMDHPDGDLRWDDVPELHREIVALVERYQPAAVITFAEDGLYWHLDHIGVHERTFTAVQSFGDAAPPLYYVTMPQGVMRALAEAAHARGAAPRDSSFWGIAADAFGDAAKPATFTIDVRPWIGRKLAALRCHRTQLGADNPLTWVDEDEARDWLGTEHYRRAAIAGRDESPLEQLGDGVPST